jgi:hypothetical protein
MSDKYSTKVNRATFLGGSPMGDKNDNKKSKKLTTKEKKAQSHLKLMQGSKDRSGVTTTTAQADNNKDKKAA